MSDFWNIEKLNGQDNMPGGRSFLFIDPDDIVVDPYVINNNIDTAHALVAGKTWWSAEFTELSLGFTESESIKAGAYVTTPTLKGYVPKDNLTLLNLMFKIAKHGLVVLYLDNNGNVRQLGSKENPAKLKRSTTHGSAGNANKVAFAISAITGQEGAPFYQSSLPPAHVCGGNTPTIQAIFAEGYNDVPDFIVGADAAGDYNTEQSDGASAPFVYKINTVVTPLPFSLDNGDVLGMNRTNSAAAGWVKLSYV